MSHLLHNFNQIPVDPGLVAVFPITLTFEVVYSRYCVIPFIKPQNQGELPTGVSSGAGGRIPSGGLWVEVTFWVLPTRLVHSVHTYHVTLLSLARFPPCALRQLECGFSHVLLEGQHTGRAISAEKWHLRSVPGKGKARRLHPSSWRLGAREAISTSLHGTTFQVSGAAPRSHCGRPLQSWPPARSGSHRQRPSGHITPEPGPGLSSPPRSPPASETPQLLAPLLPLQPVVSGCSASLAQCPNVRFPQGSVLGFPLILHPFLKGLHSVPWL